jgi:hypothetical protein
MAMAPWKIWMVDFAREQAPTRDHLYRYASHALDSGYTALGLYLEHRFAYPSAPWAHGRQAITPDMVRDLQSEFPSLEIIPFINLLGHMEGFIYAQEGKDWRAERFSGLQASANAPGFYEFAEKLLDDTMSAFSSSMIHIGGDETAQLISHPRDAELAAQQQGDPKAYIYAKHFGPLIEKVSKSGRIPGLWGDMLLEHPEALSILPKETVIFDWQYDCGLAQTAPKLKEAGFSVVGSPTLHVYNAPWMHLDAADTNVRTVSQDALDLQLDGICLTTWEFGLFGAADTLFPAVEGASRIIDNPASAPHLLESYPEETGSRDWARFMSQELAKLGPPFSYPSIRNGLKARLLLYRNPFLAWMRHGEELANGKAQEAMEICTRAMETSRDEGEKGVSQFVRSAIEFVLIAETASKHYAEGRPEQAISALAPSRLLFDSLENVARHTHRRIGGSLADMERCKAAKEHVETVIKRIRMYGDRQLGYLPAFDIITNPRFMPHDQGSWWLINKWANE